MIRLLTFSLLAFTVLNADSRPAAAWVMMSVLPKGEVPRNCSQPLAQALTKVRPIRAESIDGFGHYSCTLYYRGTHNNVQDLLDALGEMDKHSVVIRIDDSGKPGKLTSRKAFPLPRPMFFSYQVSISWNQLVDAGTLTPSPYPQSIILTIYSGGGIKPDELRFPDNATQADVAALKAVLKAGTGKLEIVELP